MNKLNLKNRSGLRAVIVIGFLYLLLWLVLPKPAFWGIDNGFKYQGARQFANTGSVLIEYTGAEFDPEGAFRPIIPPFGLMRGDKIAPVFSVLFMIFAGILYKVFGPVGPFLLPLFGGWISLLAGAFLWRRVVPGRHPVFFLIMLGLGTPLLFYSLALWEHALATGLIIVSFAMIVPERGSRISFGLWEPIIAGAALAMGSAFRTEVILLAIVATLFWHLTRRTRVEYYLFLSSLIVFLGVFAGINYWQVQTALPLHLYSNLHLQASMSYSGTVSQRFSNIYILISKGFKDPILSSVLLLPVLFGAVSRWWRTSKNMGYLVASAVLIVWLFYIGTSILSSDRVSYTLSSGGMLWVSPILTLALIPFGLRIKGIWGMLWMSSMICIGVMAIALPTSIGVHWGPRFILSFLPLLLVLACIRIQHWWGRYSSMRPFIVVLVAITILNQLYSFGLLYESRQYNSHLNNWALESGALPALTNSWWLAGDCSLGSETTPWYVANTRGRVLEVVAGLRKSNVRGFVMYEYPPYLQEKDWWFVGAEVKSADYFLEGKGKLRRTRLKVIF